MSNVSEQAGWAKKWVDIVANHDDEDLVVREAILDDLIAYTQAAKTEARDRATARVNELLGKTPTPAAEA